MKSFLLECIWMDDIGFIRKICWVDGSIRFLSSTTFPALPYSWSELLSALDVIPISYEFSVEHTESDDVHGLFGAAVLKRCSLSNKGRSSTDSTRKRMITFQSKPQFNLHIDVEAINKTMFTSDRCVSFESIGNKQIAAHSKVDGTHHARTLPNSPSNWEPASRGLVNGARSDLLAFQITMFSGLHVRQGHTGGWRQGEDYH